MDLGYWEQSVYKIITKDSFKLDLAAKKLGIKRFVAQNIQSDKEYIETDKSLVFRMYLKNFGYGNGQFVEFWYKLRPYAETFVSKIQEM